MGAKKRTIFHEVIKTEEQYEEIVAKSCDNGVMAVIDCHLDWCGPCIPMVPNYASLFFNFDDPENRIAFYQYPESAMSDTMKADMALDIKPRYIIVSNGNISATIEGNHYVELCAAINKFIPEGPED